MKPIPILAAALAAAAAAPALAQGAAYRPQPDTVYLQSLNAYRMYAVRGGDTLGGPVVNLYVERRTWNEHGGGRLRMVSRRNDLNVLRAARVDTFVVAPTGAIETINGRANEPRGQYDALPRLPARGGLAPGAAWGDTVQRSGRGQAGDYVYSAIRRYRVAGPAPDGRGVRVEAEGEVRYRDAYAVGDSAHWWIDVSGPMTAAFTFEPAEGRLLGHEWRMDLRGRAGLPREGGGVDTVPAGLASSLVQRPVTAERARLLARELPGRDTSFTSVGGTVVLLHTVSRDDDAIESGLARNDGVVGTARTAFEDGRPRRYHAVWTDSAGVLDLTVDGRGRRLHVGGTREADVPLPEEGFWAVADYGLEEHLGPALMALPLGTVRLSVYRPYAARWDAYTADVGPVSGGRLVTLTDEAGAAQRLLLAPGGELLVHEARGGQRRPAEGSRRAELLEDLLAAVRGAQGEPEQR